MSSLSIIVPVGPAEQTLGDLPDKLLAAFTRDHTLALNLRDWELIVVFCEGSGHLACQLPEHPAVRIVYAAKGRAQQMNAGASLAKSEFVWFLHLDSQIKLRHLHCLSVKLLQSSDAVFYFPLAFDGDGSGPMRLNQWGANVRSDYLGVPFGDQAFCLSRINFQKLGGYPENVAYGEDHLLIWYARQEGLPLLSTGIALGTSARKYAVHGWMRLTVRYQYLWLKQAWPELLCLLRLKFKLRE